MIPTLETPRLILRPLQHSDAEAHHRYISDWEIARYLAPGFPWPYLSENSVDYLRRNVDTGKLVWAITVKDRGMDSDELIGVIELRPDEDEGQRGFWLARAFQSRGYMTEAINVTNDYWFDVLGRDSLQITNAKGNGSSSRLKEKTGARLLEVIEDTFLDPGLHPCRTLGIEEARLAEVQGLEPLITIKRIDSEAEMDHVAMIHMKSWQSAYTGIIDQDYLDAMDATKRAEKWKAGYWDNKDDPTWGVFLAYEDEQPLGFAFFGPGRTPELGNVPETYAIYLLPEAWGKGIGYQLFQACRDDFKSRGYTQTYLWALADNQRARQSYKKWGGKPTPLQKTFSIAGAEFQEVVFTFDLLQPSNQLKPISRPHFQA